MPHIPHPLDNDVSLLYIGISPVRMTSGQTIRSRVIGNHLNGNVGSSTFRFVLAALLMDALDLRPYLRGAKVALEVTDNARLTAWQREYLQLTWCARERAMGDRGRDDRATGTTVELRGQRDTQLLHTRARGAR